VSILHPWHPWQHYCLITTEIQPWLSSLFPGSHSVLIFPKHDHFFSRTVAVAVKASDLNELNFKPENKIIFFSFFKPENKCSLQTGAPQLYTPTEKPNTLQLAFEI
jgi:hypothetical protein